MASEQWWLSGFLTGPLSDLGALTDVVGLQGCVLSLVALCCIGLILALKTRWTTPTHSLPTEEWRTLLDLTKTAYLPQNKARVMAVLDGSLDVNEHRDPVTGLTLLLGACLSGQLDLVTALLDKGADPKVLTTTGHSALSLATYACCTIESTNIKLVDLLACRGVDVNAQDKTGGTVLSVAALYGRADIASLLLQYGANPGLCGESKVRPFDLAEEEGNRAVARLIDTYTHAHTLEP